jgi:hypothetical protein
MKQKRFIHYSTARLSQHSIEATLNGEESPPRRTLQRVVQFLDRSER